MAVDAIGARVMGFDPGHYGNIRVFAESGAGTLKADEIEVPGDSIQNLF